MPVAYNQDHMFMFCDCHNDNHHIVVAYDEDIGLEFSIKLNHHLPWYHRLLNAMRYIFKYKTAYDYDTVCISGDDNIHAIQTFFNNITKEDKQDAIG